MQSPARTNVVEDLAPGVRPAPGPGASASGFYSSRGHHGAWRPVAHLPLLPLWPRLALVLVCVVWAAGCEPPVHEADIEPFARFAVGVTPHFDVRVLALLASGTAAEGEFVSVGGKRPACTQMAFEPGEVLETVEGALRTARAGVFTGTCGDKEYRFESVKVNHVEMVARPIDGDSHDSDRRVMETRTGYLLDVSRPEERMELRLVPYDAQGRTLVAEGRYGRVWSVPPECAGVVALLDKSADPTSTNRLGFAPVAMGTCIVTARYFGKTLTKAINVRCSENAQSCQPVSAGQP